MFPVRIPVGWYKKPFFVRKCGLDEGSWWIQLAPWSTEAGIASWALVVDFSMCMERGMLDRER
jgi:hypothetical protein